ncbi:peptidase M48-like protein [Geodermatophilus tzadiensis]|uniref:Peptidase M48-like protein n=1 Tax=Geodermatophilus tzadiensis TaxID=1137988 RepID=A0A2T0TZL2_9ACTN|nr:M48 family metalloprotease [Geodermatophilus tzadiensis]PRY51112.1 peptidase M48-like protein [Geodermatophilus tzadiensis]
MTGTAAPPGTTPRVDVLALPRTTTLRAILLVATMVGTGLVVGTMLHNLVLADPWNARFRECTVVPEGGPGVLAETFTACMAPVEQRRVAIALVMGALVLVLAWIVVLVAPTVHERRRGLRPLDGGNERARCRFAELAAEAGLRRPPLLVRGGSLNGVTDAHAYGRPGDWRVVVPLKLLALAGTPRADAVMRHELAHVAHRDVGFTWLARASWDVLGPLLLLPLFLALAVGDLEVVPDYLVRAAVLAVVVQLVRAGLLRAREVDADLSAVRRGTDPEVMLGQTAATRDRRSGGGIARLLATHPSPAERGAALRAPHLAARLGFVDALAAGFLAATVLPVLRAAAASTIGGAPEREWSVVLSIVPVGVLLGATVGLGLWRQAVAMHAVALPVRSGPVVAGVGAGALAGQLTSLAGVGLGAPAGFDPLWAALVLPVGLAGATALVAGLGLTWAGAAGRWRGPAAVWTPAVVLASALCTVAAWATGSVALSLGQVGWAGTSEVLQVALSGWLVTAVAVVLAGAAAVALIAPSPAAVPPTWLVPGVSVGSGDSGPATVPGLRLTLSAGLLGGLVGAAVAVVFRLAVGPPADDDVTVQRVYVLLFVAAATGAGVGLSLLVAHGVRGLGAALLAGPVATAVVGLGIVALNAALGGGLSVTATGTVLQRSSALGLLALLAVAWLPFVGGLRSEGAALAIAVAVAVGSASAVVLARDVLVPVGPAPVQAVDPEFAALDYRIRIGPAFFRASDEISATVHVIEEETTTLSSRVARYRTEVLPQARDLLARGRAFLPGSPEVAAVHQHCVAALELAVTGYEELVAGYESRREDLLEQGAAHLQQRVDEWLAWGEALDGLD